MIFFITDELPRPGCAGHLALNHAIITWLRAQNYDVTILLTGARLEHLVQTYASTHLAGPHVRQAGARVFITAPLPAAKLLGRAILNLLPAWAAKRVRQARHKADAVLGTYPAPADLRWCARAVEKAHPQAVLIDTIFRAPLLAEPELAGHKSIIIAHDLFHRRAQALAAAGYRVKPDSISRAYEAQLLRRADAIAAIQPDEAMIISAMCPDTHVFITPMPALPCPPPPGTTRIPGRLVFTGSATLPNLDGMRWFLADIWPQLAPKGVTLDIIGDCGTALTRLPQGVKAWGRVADMAPLLHRASLAIAPLRAGSGLKVKLLDYARHGLTSIVTPPALAGFQADVDSPFIVAGSAAMFAQAVQRQLRHPPEPARAIGYCTRHYSMEASFAGLHAALLQEEPKPAPETFRALKL